MNMDIIFKFQFCNYINNFQFIFGEERNECKIPNEMYHKKRIIYHHLLMFFLKISQKMIEQFKNLVSQNSHFKMSSEFSVIIS